MDASLAKGLKNSMFRQIENDVQISSNRLGEYSKKLFNIRSRNQWPKFLGGLYDLMGKLIVAKYHGGTQRKPFICFCLFEGEERKYNSWKENCINSTYVYFSINPPNIVAHPIGFSISDHAIQRIYERAFSDTDPINENFSKFDFSRELIYVPIWSLFWSSRFVNYHDQEKKASVVIPAPNGLFFGEINDSHFHISEIRTFLAVKQLNAVELSLWKDMMKLSDEYLNSIFPFILFLSSRDTGSRNYADDFDVFMNKVAPLEERLMQYLYPIAD